MNLNYFAFEHEARTVITEIMRPVILRQLEDRTSLKSQGVNMVNLAERVEAIEIIYNMHDGQNVMLDTL